MNGAIPPTSINYNLRFDTDKGAKKSRGLTPPELNTNMTPLSGGYASLHTRLFINHTSSGFGTT